MDEQRHSLMESSGLGLLPGVVLALALILTVMAALLTESMWAVAGVLFVIRWCSWSSRSAPKETRAAACADGSRASATRTNPPLRIRS
jgi:hypothetical protein